jgi:hypothetical protein
VARWCLSGADDIKHKVGTTDVTVENQAMALRW